MIRIGDKEYSFKEFHKNGKLWIYPIFFTILSLFILSHFFDWLDIWWDWFCEGWIVLVLVFGFGGYVGDIDRIRLESIKRKEKKS